ncbi:NAD(P)H-hydrate dehydratase [Eubacterium xylanophilum]|uniref:NAD(P)H-hydrate dehydratase n=1 Tax=Eubacterium xylanophilum TaxID=39497 RepID=UPI00047CB284|nr:NAD(P)H-hydrate dehydratase [Eubacterium xylanophilum]
MIKLLDKEQARRLDQYAINVVGVPGLVLMEKAAMTLVKVIMNTCSPGDSGLIICGTGNNGGDGIAVARLLKENGYDVALLFVGNMDKMSEDAKHQMKLAAACKVQAVQDQEIEGSRFDYIVDGIFGVGLSRPIEGKYSDIIDRINNSGKRVYAIDVPSGIDATTGEILGTAVKANYTVTFGANKLGLVIGKGREYAGQVTIADIGYPEVCYEAVSSNTYCYDETLLPSLLPVRPCDGNKGTFGHVAVVAGSDKMCGAAILAAKAAYRMGAGLVKVYSSAINRDIILSTVPEAIFQPIDSDTSLIIDDIRQFADACVVGPGLGISDKSKSLVEDILENINGIPVVIDADAFQVGIECLKSSDADIIVTPHPGEFSRLIGIDVPTIKRNLPSYTIENAREIGCIFVAKDSRTMVSNGDELYVNISGNSGMGTGGSGDVLTGIIAALAAAGMNSFDAAKLGVYVHGLAADYFTREYNEYSLMASDIIESLKKIL